MKKKIPFHILTVIFLVALDQITKYLAVKNLSGNGGYEIIKGVFKLYLLEGGNSGAASGILQGKFYFFAIITVVIVLILGYILYKIPTDKKYTPLSLTLLFLVSGALGNFIDRVYTYLATGKSSVVDFLYFHLIEFPIFNVADIYVTCSAIALFLLILFYYKDTDLGFLKLRKADK